MGDETAAETGEHGDEAGVEDAVWSRDTAPQTSFTLRQVGIGLVIAVIGAAVAFGIPVLLT